MRPDPLENARPDHPFYLIGSAAGILLALAGAYHTHFVMNGGRLYLTVKGNSLASGYLTTFESYAISAGLLLGGVALFLVARRWRNR